MLYYIFLLLQKQEKENEDEDDELKSFISQIKGMTGLFDDDPEDCE